jgi:hypothetical protein
MKVSWMNQQTRNFQAQCVCMCVGCGLAADRQFETVKSSHNPELVFRSGCVGGLPALKRATVITKWRNNASQNVRFVLDCVTIQNLILNYLTGNPIFNFFFICFTAWLWVNSGLTFANLCSQFWCYKDKDACPVWTGSIFLSASWRFIWLFFSRRLCHSAFQKSIRLLLSGLPQGRNQSVLCNVLMHRNSVGSISMASVAIPETPGQWAFIHCWPIAVPTPKIYVCLCILNYREWRRAETLRNNKI